MNLYLIGYRCTGKTTLGRELARKLAREFVDMDDLLVAEAGQSINDMVAEKGWPYFRSRESALLNRLADKDSLVVGTGGGVILDPANVDRMRASGKVILLQCSSDTINQRLQGDSRTREMRPALTDKGLIEEIESVLQERKPFYQGAAHITLATDDIDIPGLCKEIIAKLDGVTP
jgi:shikimate kinase